MTCRQSSMTGRQVGVGIAPVFRRQRLRRGGVLGHPIRLGRRRRAVADWRIGQARARRLGLERRGLTVGAAAEELLHAAEQAAPVAELARLVLAIGLLDLLR